MTRLRMNNVPILTIITITYNAGQYLDRTLRSVQLALPDALNQNAIEYLLIDGGSRDDTLKIAEAYSSLLTRIVSERDKGLYDAMNKGQALATGTYLWFLNAGDEVYERTTLAQLLAALQKGGDVFYSDAMLVRENGLDVGLRSKFTPHSLPDQLRWDDFALGMKVCHQAFIASREIAPSYDITNLSADIDWEIECLKKSTKTVYLNFVLCRYLMGGTSVQNHRRSLLDRFKVLHKHFGLMPSLFNHLYLAWRGFWFARKNGRYW